MLSPVINSDLELLILGILYIALSWMVLPVFAVIIWILLINPIYRGNVSYQLINLMNFCNVAQCICHQFTGFFLIFPKFFAENFPVDSGIIGTTGNSAFLADFIILTILSLVRMEISYFKVSGTQWTPWMIISLSVGGLYVLITWLIGLITHNYNLIGPIWAFDVNVPFARSILSVQMVIYYGSLSLSYVSYLIIIISIYKSKISEPNQSYHLELRILIPATLSTVYISILMALWRFMENWFQMTTLKYAALHILWILFSHLNLALLIFTNRGIRREIRKLFKSKAKVSLVTSRQGNS